jgi:hypothetical protein
MAAEPPSFLPKAGADALTHLKIEARGVSSLAGLAHFCPRLTTIYARGNQIEDIE